MKGLSMELRIVKRPLQDFQTKFEDLEYVEFITEDGVLKRKIPNWCVDSFIFREGDGGLQLWFNKIKQINPDILYLYEIRSYKDKIVNGENEEDWFEDTIYHVRCDMKMY